MFIQVFVADYIGESWEHSGKMSIHSFENVFVFLYCDHFLEFLDWHRKITSWSLHEPATTEVEEFNSLGRVTPESNDILPDAL